jgi:hypothetical protein
MLHFDRRKALHFSFVYLMIDDVVLWAFFVQLSKVIIATSFPGKMLLTHSTERKLSLF